MNIYQRINAVRKAIKYVQKDKDVSTGKGSYRAVTHDMVTAMVRPHLVEHGVVCYPVLVESAAAKPPAKDGVESNQIRYEATYDFFFVNETDPADRFCVRIQAHAMDNADKAPGKALSYAKKYAVLKVFEIETGEDEEGRMDREDGMPEKQVADFVASITDCASMEDLLAAFTKAYKAAQEASDKEAMQVFTKAKDNRKKALAQ